MILPLFRHSNFNARQILFPALDNLVVPIIYHLMSKLVVISQTVAQYFLHCLHQTFVYTLLVKVQQFPFLNMWHAKIFHLVFFLTILVVFSYSIIIYLFFCFCCCFRLIRLNCYQDLTCCYYFDFGHYFDFDNFLNTLLQLMLTKHCFEDRYS